MSTEPTCLQASWGASTAAAWAAEGAFGIGDPSEVRRARTQLPKGQLHSLLCM